MGIKSRSLFFPLRLPKSFFKYNKMKKSREFYSDSGKKSREFLCYVGKNQGSFIVIAGKNQWSFEIIMCQNYLPSNQIIQKNEKKIIKLI